MIVGTGVDVADATGMAGRWINWPEVCLKKIFNFLTKINRHKRAMVKVEGK